MIAKGGKLTVVGTGIRAMTQLTPEARHAIVTATRVFTNLGDAAARAWIDELNPRTQSLLELYAPGTDRMETYGAMSARIADAAIAGERVCFVTTGHPGVFSYPAHRAIRLARAAGVPAIMLPGVSAEDCLFADLGIDPGDGLASYEATIFLVRRPPIDRMCALVLWQIGAIGEAGWKRDARAWNPGGIRLLAQVLADVYGSSHRAVVYEAARYAFLAPRIIETTPAELDASMVTLLSTLYVPAAATRPPDLAMAERLRASALVADEVLQGLER